MATTKGIRLHAELRRQFEEHCRANLLDERAVIEAWLLQFLEATAESRQQAAARYSEWLDEQSKPERKLKKEKD